MESVAEGVTKINPLKGNLQVSVIFALALLTLWLSACAVPMAQRCAAGQQQFINEMLYFGTDTPDGEVSQEDWQGFVEAVVTPRFPQGLTAWPAYGQWRMNTGEIVQEGSYVLSLLHAGEAERNAAVVEIMEAYKLQFRQEAVLRVQSPVCVSF